MVSWPLYGQSAPIVRVESDYRILSQALDLAKEFAANPAPQLLMTKQLLTRNGSDTDLTEIQQRESALLRECWKTEEHKEAVSAFIEKRQPRFR